MRATKNELFAQRCPELEEELEAHQLVLRKQLQAGRVQVSELESLKAELTRKASELAEQQKKSRTE